LALSRRLPALALLALGASAAAARTVHLTPAGALPAGPLAASWAAGVSQDGEPEALAAGHPLRPRVTAGHLTQVAVELPGAGLLRVLPAGLRGADADADLPLGRPWIDTAASDGERLVVRDA
jgi:hypothetical protein